MKGLRPNIENMVYVQQECASFFEATPDAETRFSNVINEVCKNDKVYARIDVELTHGDNTKWRQCVRIHARFTNKDNTKSDYSFGATYWSEFIVML